MRQMETEGWSNTSKNCTADDLDVLLRMDSIVQDRPRSAKLKFCTVARMVAKLDWMDATSGAVDDAAAPAAAADVDAIGGSTAACPGFGADAAISDEVASKAIRWAQTSRSANMDVLPLSRGGGLSEIL